MKPVEIHQKPRRWCKFAEHTADNKDHINESAAERFQLVGFEELPPIEVVPPNNHGYSWWYWHNNWQGWSRRSYKWNAVAGNWWVCRQALFRTYPWYDPSTTCDWDGMNSAWKFTDERGNILLFHISIGKSNFTAGSRISCIAIVNHEVAYWWICLSSVCFWRWAWTTWPLHNNVPPSVPLPLWFWISSTLIPRMFIRERIFVIISSVENYLWKCLRNSLFDFIDRERLRFPSRLVINNSWLSICDPK